MANADVLVKARLSSLGDRNYKNDDGTVMTRRVATLVFYKDEHAKYVEAINEAVKGAMVEEFGKVIKPSKVLIKDGDTATRVDNDAMSPTFGEEILISNDSTHLKNAFYITGINAERVVMYNTHKRLIDWDDFVKGDQDLYVGCFVQAKLNFSVYQNQYGIIVSKYLNAMALDRDGERIGGGSSSADHSADGFEFNASPVTNDAFL